MFLRLRNRFYRLLAEAAPVRLNYWCARNVLAEAACTAYADTPAREIKAMDALQHWEDSHMARARDRSRERGPGSPIWDRSGLERDQLLSRDQLAPDVLEVAEGTPVARTPAARV